jgi:hypothetical protein
MGPNAAAEMTLLLFEVGGTGACHRSAPIGGAAKRMLAFVNIHTVYDVLEAVVRELDIPLECIQSSRRVCDTLVDSIP